MTSATQHAREGNGPFLIEAVTYRMGAHSSSDDPRMYRSDEEVEEWRKRDPIQRMQNYLKESGYWGEQEQTALEDRLNQEILDAVAQAEKLPPPPVETLFEDVFSEVLPHLQEQKAKLLKTGH
jgi:2-oxoisovalerate dehydrogenase E1 component alpha subunit